jgi:bifunctional DNA-binding transcriptional regulator/antitoxin component of YhaV-PrlF toxin-antitoxin module
MATTSKLTSQAQVSVPAGIRRKLGLAPSSVLAWENEGDRVVVRRVGTYSSEEIHAAIFKEPAKPESLAELKRGIRESVRKRHARG